MPSNNTNSTPTKRLFLGNLAYEVTESDIIQKYVTMGKVVDVQVIRDPKRYSRGYGYVEFENLEDAIAAKNHFSGALLKERDMIVDFAKEDPLKTEFGQERYKEARTRNPEKFEHQFRPKKPKLSPTKKGPGGSERIRQSVYDQRVHGARPGKKFARRTQGK